MQLSRFVIKGIEPETNKPFEAVCVAYDIVSAITYFRDRGYVVMDVSTRERVPDDTPIKIEKFRVIFN